MGKIIVSKFHKEDAIMSLVHASYTHLEEFIVIKTDHHKLLMQNSDDMTKIILASADSEENLQAIEKNSRSTYMITDNMNVMQTYLTILTQTNTTRSINSKTAFMYTTDSYNDAREVYFTKSHVSKDGINFIPRIEFNSVKEEETFKLVFIDNKVEDDEKTFQYGEFINFCGKYDLDPNEFPAAKGMKGAMLLPNGLSSIAFNQVLASFYADQEDIKLNETNVKGKYFFSIENNNFEVYVLKPSSLPGTFRKANLKLV